MVWELRRAGKFPKSKPHGKLYQGVAFALAKLVTEEIKTNIRKNRLGLPKGTPDWVRKSLDKRPLIDTRDYVNGLKAIKIPRTIEAAITGDVLLSKRLEYGTSKMSPRPHIGPSVRSAEEKLGAEISRDFIDELFSD